MTCAFLDIVVPRRRLCPAYPGFADYEKKTNREIPVVILERR
ncbi:hypothetical protein [Cryobacterium sp. PH29-G1]|nr:hypothetical protein [Cryobacterium sp. PH29-G1]MDJ0350538.1 hypothetical protein [Cryobacterium sp. PH29-G1]